MMDVRPKKALGQHFLTDLSIARRIVDALAVPDVTPAGGCVDNRDCLADSSDGLAGNSGHTRMPVLEIGPGMGVLSQFLLERDDIDFKMVEIDSESVAYLRTHFPSSYGRLLEDNFLTMDLKAAFGDSPFRIIGNFPYNISSPIFFRILENHALVPEVVCMLQKEVAERIATGPGSKTYGILSVLSQTWYDIEYLFTVGSGAFCPPPKVQSAVIRLKRNGRQSLGCDEALFRKVVKTAFGQRRKTLRNSLKPLAGGSSSLFGPGSVGDLRPEVLSVDDFISLTQSLM